MAAELMLLLLLLLLLLMMLLLVLLLLLLLVVVVFLLALQCSVYLLLHSVDFISFFNYLLCVIVEKH